MISEEERLWQDLIKHEDTFESPEWHRDVLAEREKALAEGKETVSDWGEAKERIRRKVSDE